MTIMTEMEQAEILANRAKVKELLPDMVPFFRELSDLGMIPGWRCIRRVRAFTDPEWPPERAVPAIPSHEYYVSTSKDTP